MLDEIFDWFIAALPTKVLLGCAALLLIGVALFLLWIHYG